MLSAVAGVWKSGVVSLAALGVACSRDCPAPSAPVMLAGAHRAEASAAAPASAPLIGTAHPYALLETDPEGRYVVLCQARDDTNGDGEVRSFRGMANELGGDALVPYLIERGTGRAIEALLARSASGRYLALVEQARVVLLDSETHVALPLRDALVPGADPARIEGSSSLAFAADERRMIYLGRRDGRIAAVVHDLSSHREQILPAVPDDLSGVTLSPDSSWAMLRTLSAQQLPGLNLLRSRRDEDGPCRRPSGFDWRDAVDSASSRWLVPIVGGAPRTATDYLMLLGGGLLRRAGDGALWLDRASGDKAEVAPASCGAVLQRANEHSVVVACKGAVTNEYEDVPLYAFHGGQLSPLGIGVQFPEEATEERSERFWVFAGRVPGPTAPPREREDDEDGDEDDSDEERFVFDSEQGKLLRLGSGQVPEGEYGDKLLLGERGRLLLLDARSGQVTVVAEHVAGITAQTSGRFAFMAPLLIDLELGRVVGEQQGDALAVTSTGMLLVAPEIPAPTEPSAPARFIIKKRDDLGLGFKPLPFGPLRWVALAK